MSFAENDDQIRIIKSVCLLHFDSITNILIALSAKHFLIDTIENITLVYKLREFHLILVLLYRDPRCNSSLRL